jgi:2-polyprenyl-3-methyl-5-hydroxy-6-metoxy-1,4-benzoquinol methylase
MGVQERLSFEDATAPTLIAGEHRHRYRLAASLLEGRRVLDLCCGTGYGSAILAETASSVYGVDVDAATVDAADAALRHAGNADFEVADAVEFLGRWNVAERFDAIVCFEGLEHLRELEAAIGRLRELAEGGMTMILSVPNSAGLGEENEFHVTDFSWERTLEQLGSFPGATVLTQYLAEGSVICAAEPGDPAPRIELGDRHEPEYANHYIVCVGVDADPLDGLMQVEAAPVANRYLRDVENANRELRRANARLTRERLGKADAAAASDLARRADREEVERELVLLRKEHKAWIERCLGAEERERALAARLATQMETAANLDRVSALLFLKVLDKLQFRRRKRPSA